MAEEVKLIINIEEEGQPPSSSAAPSSKGSLPYGALLADKPDPAALQKMREQWQATLAQKGFVLTQPLQPSIPAPTQVSGIKEVGAAWWQPTEKGKETQERRLTETALSREQSDRAYEQRMEENKKRGIRSSLSAIKPTKETVTVEEYQTGLAAVAGGDVPPRPPKARPGYDLLGNLIAPPLPPRQQPPPPPIRAELADGGMGGGIPPRIISLAQSALSSITSAGITKATGSATLGGLGGTGAGMLAMAGMATPAAPVIAAFGAIVIAGIAVKETFDKLRSILKESGESIKEFSAPMAEAAAMAEVRMTVAYLRRAQVAGKEIAGAATAESRLEVSIEDLKTTISKAVGDEIAGILKATQGLVELVRLQLETFLFVKKAYQTWAKENPWADAAVKGLMGPTGALFTLLQKMSDLADVARKEQEMLVEAEQMQFFGIGRKNLPARDPASSAARGAAFGMKYENLFNSLLPAPRSLPKGVLE